MGIKIGKISKTLTILGGTILVGVSYSLKNKRKLCFTKNNIRK
ncbi:hypothetical protein V3433_06525 [Fusobacterium polymorphum]